MSDLESYYHTLHFISKISTNGGFVEDDDYIKGAHNEQMSPTASRCT